MRVGEIQLVRLGALCVTFLVLRLTCRQWPRRKRHQTFSFTQVLTVLRFATKGGTQEIDIMYSFVGGLMLMLGFTCRLTRLGQPAWRCGRAIRVWVRPVRAGSRPRGRRGPRACRASPPTRRPSSCPSRPWPRAPSTDTCASPPSRPSPPASPACPTERPRRTTGLGPPCGK